jgi:hypothetical protein
LTSFSGKTTGKILIVAALALLLAGAAGARVTFKVLGTTTSPLKGGLYYYANGNAMRPKTLSAKVKTVPAQSVLLQWSVSCSKGAPPGGVGEDAYDPSSSQKSGQKSVRSPATQLMPLPYANPKTCSVSLYAKLTHKAKTTLQILQG